MAAAGRRGERLRAKGHPGESARFVHPATFAPLFPASWTESSNFSVAKVPGGDWASEYKAYIKRNGAHLAALSWKGFESQGRGAIFAKYDGLDGKACVLYIKLPLRFVMWRAP
jgi:hypothetical protein